MKAAILAILRQQEDSHEYTWGPTIDRLQALFDARNTPASEASTKRELIAVAAMQGILAGRQAALDTPYVVHRSLEIADALIAKLKEARK